MISLAQILQSADAMGLTDVLLPFTLIFSVVFAALSMVKIFGENGKRYNVIVALVIALLVVVPHVTGTYPAGKDVVEIINSAIPNVSIIIVAIVMIMILMGVFGAQFNLASSGLLKGLLPVIALVVVAFIFGKSAGWFGSGLPSWLGFLNDSDTVAVILVILVFFIIISIITYDDKGEGEAKGISRIINSLGKMIK